MKKTVVIGIIGSTLDAGRFNKRWDKWRPTVDLCRQPDLLIHRYELLCDRRHTKLANTLTTDIASVSPETEVRPHDVGFRDPWDFEEVYAKLHDFAKSYSFVPEEEEYLVNVTTGTHVAQICLYLLTESRYFPARLLQASPAGKQEVGGYSIIDLDLSKYDKLSSRFQKEKQDSRSFLKSGIATQNKQFNALIDQIERVAFTSKEPILLTGPTGAGKSQLARRIFELKKLRREVTGKFIEVNCATLRGDGAMSALFGHKKGAFTGAMQDRPGLLLAAHEGVLFLDEIGELGLDEQAMLLRAVEEKRFLPFGSDREVESSFQLLVGTNKNLAKAVREGEFREDLLARVNLWTFDLPGLRHRPEDIEPNLSYELEKRAQAEGTNFTMNTEAREAFLKFAKSKSALWSGNFRDFNAAVTRMTTLSEGGRITKPVVADEVERLRQAWSGAKTELKESGSLEELLSAKQIRELDLFDRVQLKEVLSLCQRHRSLSEAGRELFAVSRQSRSKPNDADRLRKYLLKFGLTWDRIVGASN